MQVKIDAIHEATDLDLIERRIEAMYFDVKRFGKTLIVSHTSTSMNATSGFRLARLLHNNSDLVDYTLDEVTADCWAKADDAIKKE